MPSFAWRPLLVLLGLCLLAPASLAQDEKTPGEQAKEHYEAGRRLYEAGEFAEALEEFTAAYELKPAPLLLFNMGQCQRHLKNYEKAIFLLEGYLRKEPDTPHRNLVEQLLDESRRGLEEEKARPDLASLETKLVEELARREAELAERLARLETTAKTADNQRERDEAQRALKKLAAKDAEISRLREQLAELREKESGDDQAALEAKKKAEAEEQARAEERKLELERIRAEIAALRQEREAEDDAGLSPWVWAGAAGGGAILVAGVAVAGATAAGLVGASLLFPLPSAGTLDLQ